MKTLALFNTSYGIVPVYDFYKGFEIRGTLDPLALSRGINFQMVNENGMGMWAKRIEDCRELIDVDADLECASKVEGFEGLEVLDEDGAPIPAEINDSFYYKGRPDRDGDDD